MEIYLIRHGIAVEAEATASDEDRWLTKRGAKKVRRVASNLRSLDLEIDIILSSPLVRAQQTAELLVSKGLSETLEIHPDLAPAGNLDHCIQWLQDYQFRNPIAQSVVLVGHEPDLSNLAEMLLFNQIFQRIHIKKAGIIALHWPVTTAPLGNCQLSWLMPPKFWL
jgi:phosphohistidine phosphatase